MPNSNTPPGTGKILLDSTLPIPEPALELTIVDNVAVQPIFVMSQDMRSYVQQIGDVWQEVPLRAADNGAGLRSTARHGYSCSALRIASAWLRSRLRSMRISGLAKFTEAGVYQMSRNPDPARIRSWLLNLVAVEGDVDVALAEAADTFSADTTAEA